jgi:hypothetical protein
MTNGQKSWPRPILKQIATGHSREAAVVFESYEPGAEEWDIFKRVSFEVLQQTRFEAGACTVLSALLAKRLTEALGTPVPVVAGALKIAGQYMFGSDRSFDGAETFSRSADDWDGHCWILLGRRIVDASLGRTARTGRCPPLLSRTVISAYGEQAGVVAGTNAEMRDVGLFYLPRYVLTPAQVAALAAGAEYRYGI